jgi:4-hydroxythreonine-4-phosphate dehydrogenase
MHDFANRPRHIILTPGDPTGIGPEITVKALQRLNEFPNAALTVIGSLKALAESAAQLGLPLPQDNRIEYQAIEDEKPGAVAYRALDEAVRIIALRHDSLLVTGPISKRNLKEAGYEAHGHTEILEELTKQYFPVVNDPKAEMLFAHRNFRLLLLTRHIALKDVPEAIAKPGAIARPLKTLIAFLRHKLKIDEPRIALLAINPHAGEVGGDEEAKYIKPVVHAVNAIGASRLEGPFPADAFFRGFDPQNSGYDAVVAAYHDQGLIPFKLLAGFEAVNITIGLPFVRTSVSHGTAEDIAGRGIAREDSLIAALHAALKTL